MNNHRRVAVTGVGVIGPCGTDAASFFEGLCQPAPAPFTERVVPEFDLSPYFDSPKESRRLDRFTHFAAVAAAEAIAAAGPLSAAPERIGVHLGTGIGGIATVEEQVLNLHNKGPRRVSPFLVPMMMANASSAFVSMRYGYKGPCENTVTACAASTQSIGSAADQIRWNKVDAMVTGGSEASLTPTGMQGFVNMTATSSSGISRPFDRERDGFIQSEGGAVLILEEMEMAKARGADILAEVLGSASTADAHHITAPAPGGDGAVRCMKLALEDAGLNPEDVTHINAHGTSTPLNDAAEAGAIHAVFGADGPLVTSTKGITGHALGAAGALEAAAVVLAMKNKAIPATAGYETPDPEMAAIRIVRDQAEEWTPGPSLSNSFGFGGHNATVVFAPA